MFAMTRWKTLFFAAYLSLGLGACGTENDDNHEGNDMFTCDYEEHALAWSDEVRESVTFETLVTRLEGTFTEAFVGDEEGTVQVSRGEGVPAREDSAVCDSRFLVPLEIALVRDTTVIELSLSAELHDEVLNGYVPVDSAIREHLALSELPANERELDFWVEFELGLDGGGEGEIFRSIEMVYPDALGNRVESVLTFSWAPLRFVPF